MNNIRVRTLQCGMPLVVETMTGVKSAAMSWLVPAGVATEPESGQGLSTLWAELLMRGAGALTSREHADALDKLGVSRGAEPGMQHLRVAATMLGSRVSQALPLIVDMVRRPRFDAESIGPARELALQALESLKDDPTARAGIAARARHFPPPFNRSSLGTREGIEGATRDVVVESWTRRAMPVGSILAFAGAVDPDELERQLDDLLKGWGGSAAEASPNGTPARGYGHESDESNQVQIMLLHDAPREPETTSILEKVTVSVLSGGMAGRLFTEVREKRGLCYSVSAGYSGGKLFGALEAYVGTTPERAQESLDVLAAELARINTQEGLVTQAELDRAILGMKSRLVFSGESTAARAGALAADMHRLGRPRTLDEIAGELDRVTLTRLNDYLAGRRPGTMTIQTLGPAALRPPAV
jgi:predicted Zn-dependent peptidase